MTTQQTIVVAVLWLMVGGLFGLVLLLYRSVERAYRQGNRGQQSGLLPGAEAPPVEILTGAGIGFLEPLSLDAPYLLGFVSGECEDCTQLLDALVSGDGYEGRAALILVDGRSFDTAVPSDAPVEIHPAAHPPDIQRGYGVSVLPLVYLMKGRTVLAVGAATTPTQLRVLQDDARRTEAKMANASNWPYDEGSPVRVLIAGGGEASRDE